MIEGKYEIRIGVVGMRSPGLSFWVVIKSDVFV